MSRRGRSTSPVQLFPFLAVLVCVMGALIFLLLVTSRQMRDVAIARALAELPVAAIATPTAPEPLAEPEIPEPESANDAPAIADAADLAARRGQLRAELDERTLQSDRLAALLEQQRLLVAAAQRRAQALQEELQQAEQKFGALTGQIAATRLSTPNSDAERRQLEQLILRLRQQLKEIEDQQRASAGKFAFVPFDGKSGTTRHPILIECTDSGFRFLPENVVVRPGDIDGFTEQYNPLLAGAAALCGYWSQHEGTTDESSEPYVLLVVRPSGTLAYYISQRLLARLKTPFGYELVTDDMELQLPLVDPSAKAACEAAIKKLLAEREQIAASVSSARGVGGARASGRGVPSAAGAREGFQLSDLDAAEGVGERSWEQIDRFEGQEHRNAKLAAGNAAGQGAGQSSTAVAANENRGVLPRPSPSQSATNPRGPLSDESGNSTRSSGSQSEVTTADFNDGNYPSFATQRKSQGKERSMPYELLQRRKWGRYAAGATIGLEHEVVVRVDAQRLVVDDEIAIPVPNGISRNELFDRLLSVIDRQAHTWGTAPSGFFWIPSLKFVISPGGNQVYERLSPLVTKSGLSSSAEFTLDEVRPADSRR